MTKSDVRRATRAPCRAGSRHGAPRTPSPPSSRRRSAPPAGAACRAEAVVCTRCGRRLAAAEPLLAGGPPGLDRAWSSAPHEGVARDLVAALKFRRLLPVAELMADRIQWLAPAHMLERRGRAGAAGAARGCAGRGFDPAGELAAALAERLDAPLRALPGPARRAAARSAAAAPSGSATRRGSSHRARPRAASSWSTTCSPPGATLTRLRPGAAGGRGRPGGRRVTFARRL